MTSSLVTLAAETFTIEMVDLRFRQWRATYTQDGQTIKLHRLERLQTNGKDTFWTLYRPSCHGEMPTVIADELANTQTITLSRR